MPGEAGEESVGAAEVGRDFLRRKFGEVGWGGVLLAVMADAPDTSALFVAVGMTTRDLVVGNDFVIPIDDIEAAVGAEVGRDRAERLVTGEEKIVLLFIGVLSFAVRGGRHDLETVRDGIDDNKNLALVAELKGTAFIFDEREPAQPGAAHLGAVGGGVDVRSV